MKPIPSPTGTNDILPEDQKYWRYFNDGFEKKVSSYGLTKIDTPIFEFKGLFTRSTGETTDIVEKEMFEISRAGGVLSEMAEEEKQKEPLVLRPEGTPGIARAYLEQGMQSWPQPVKLYYLGPMFRYSRPQKGRFRQFYQAGIEIIGDNDPLTDCLVILIAWQIFANLGLKNSIMIEINSIGCKTCRPKYRKKLLDYYQGFKSMLCPDCLRRMELNPLRLLDCKEKNCQKIALSAPQLIDELCENCKTHFTKVLEYLDDLNIPYDLNPRLVRGLDYYTRTTFEIRDLKDESRQSSLGGGGRYDNLLENLGGNPTPAIGWALGVERIIEKIKEEKIEIPQPKITDIFLVQLGQRARKKTLAALADLGEKGYSINCVMGKESLKSQLRAADKMGAVLALIIGEREALDDSVIVRDMEEASQETIPFAKLEKFLEKRFGKK